MGAGGHGAIQVGQRPGLGGVVALVTRHQMHMHLSVGFREQQHVHALAAGHLTDGRADGADVLAHHAALVGRERIQRGRRALQFQHAPASHRANAARGKPDPANLREEFADVLAWLTTLANISGVDLEQAVREKYMGNDGGPKGEK